MSQLNKLCDIKFGHRRRTLVISRVDYKLTTIKGIISKETPTFIFSIKIFRFIFIK